MTLDSIFDADVHQALTRRLAALQPDSQVRRVIRPPASPCSNYREFAEAAQ